MKIILGRQKAFSTLCTAVILVSGSFSTLGSLQAETLQSPNYTIKDATLNSGGQAVTSTSYSMLSAIGDYTADSRLTSGSYELKSGFPNGILANVPKVQCFETTTTSGTTHCLSFPNSKGAIGECGYSGCYNKAKIEIDVQSNPSDTLFLIQIVSDNVIYYLKSDHTLGSSFDSSNFLTKCQIEGKDLNDLNCDTDAKPGWNSTLQSYNLLGLTANTTYTASVLALNGDFTGTRFSDIASATTSSMQLTFDIDIAPESGTATETAAPYSVNLGEITLGFPSTATNLVWVDMGSNISAGLTLYIKDLNNGLYSSTKSSLIPSENENLTNDTNNNGGFGIKTYNYESPTTELGPLLRASAYNTGTTNTVGSLATTDNLLFYTNNISTNKGEIVNARGAFYLKSRSAISNPSSGDYNDSLTIAVIGNF